MINDKKISSSNSTISLKWNTMQFFKMLLRIGYGEMFVVRLENKQVVKQYVQYNLRF